MKDLSGPPGILALLAAYVNTDWRLALSFLVLLNINLAIINLFPMPVLDGGHIVMALVERLFGRPLPQSAGRIYHHGLCGPAHRLHALCLL